MDIDIALNSLNNLYKDIKKSTGIIIYLTRVDIYINQEGDIEIKRDSIEVLNQIIKVKIESISINNYEYKKEYKGYTGIYVIVDKDIPLNIKVNEEKDTLEIVRIERIQIFIKENKIKKEMVIYYRDDIYEIPIIYPTSIEFI